MVFKLGDAYASANGESNTDAVARPDGHQHANGDTITNVVANTNGHPIANDIPDPYANAHQYRSVNPHAREHARTDRHTGANRCRKSLYAASRVQHAH